MEGVPVQWGPMSGRGQGQGWGRGPCPVRSNIPWVMVTRDPHVDRHTHMVKTCKYSKGNLSIWTWKIIDLYFDVYQTLIATFLDQKICRGKLLLFLPFQNGSQKVELFHMNQFLSKTVGIYIFRYGIYQKTHLRLFHCTTDRELHTICALAFWRRSFRKRRTWFR